MAHVWPLFGQITGVLLLNVLVLTAIGVALLIVNVIVLRVMWTHLDRSRLFESQVR